MTYFHILRAIDVTSDLLETVITASIAAFALGTLAGDAFHRWHTAWVSAPTLALPAARPQLLLAPASATAELPSTVIGLRAMARELGIPSRHWRSARKATLIELVQTTA